LGRLICERIAGNETLTNICADDDMPNPSTVGRWLMRHADFSQEYAQARETQMHLEAEEIRTIADNCYEDYYIDYKEGPNGEQVPYVVVNNESIKRAQLRIDARKWRAERLNRRVYGNSIQHEHSGQIANPAGPAQLPPSLEWLAGFLPSDEPAEKPGPDNPGVGEE